MIPAEAVEAGWEQARADADGYPYPEREDVRRILEAAAPHMLAKVSLLADKWQADFPYKAQELRTAIGVTND